MSGAGVISKLLLAVWLVSTCALLSGCFIFYDSRWGQAKASQKRVAKERTPAQLRGTGSPGALEHKAKKPAQRLRIRVYATPHYEGALVNGRADFERALSDANPTLASDLSFRLELADYRVWSSNRSDDDLAQLLEAVKKEDPASDVDWVLVLASPRHMVATSPDQLGVGQYLSRYLAVRAMSDAAEFDAIQQQFTELSDTEKRNLYEARKRHKSASVLLHELGHTLGLPHELDHQSLMSPVYDVHGSAFSATSARLAQRVLELRATAFGTELHRTAAQAALNTLRSAPSHTYEAAAADHVARLLEAHAGAPAAAKPAHTLTVPSPPAQATRAPSIGSNKLDEADRALLARVRQAQTAGQFAAARALGAPLFEKYSSDLPIQELRCQLAMKVQLSMAEERVECDPLRNLSRF